jgi:hypothetical protein
MVSLYLIPLQHMFSKSENVVDINRELKQNGKAQKKKTKDAIQNLKAQVVLNRIFSSDHCTTQQADYLFWQGKYQECMQVCDTMLKLEVREFFIVTNKKVEFTLGHESNIQSRDSRNSCSLLYGTEIIVLEFNLIQLCSIFNFTKKQRYFW